MPKKPKAKPKRAGEVFKFEVVPREAGGFGIHVDGNDMLLPRGDVFWTPSRAYALFVLKTLAEGGTEHFKDNRCLLCHACTLFIDFSTGFVSPENKDFRKFHSIFGYCATYDPIHALCAGPEVVDQLAKLGPFRDFCDDRGVTPPNWSQGFFEDSDEVTNLGTVLRARCGGEVEPRILEYFHMLEREFAALSLAQRSVVFTFFTYGGGEMGSPVILPLLLAKGLCTPREFAEGFLATLCVIPGVFGDVSVAHYKRERSKIQRDAERAMFFLQHH